MFYITQSGQIYSGDQQNNDRQLTEEETELVRNGKFTVINNRVLDISLQPGYVQNQSIPNMAEVIWAVVDQAEANQEAVVPPQKKYRQAKV